MKTCKNVECKSEIDNNRTYCSLSCRNIYVNKHIRDYSKHGKSISTTKFNKYKKVYLDNPKYCKHCDDELKYSQRRNTYCSVTCSNKDRDPKIYEDIFEKSSKTVANLWQSGHYDNTSAKNHLTMPVMFSSKPERKIYKHFKESFPNDDWRSGGQLKYKDYRISRDLYSPKLKICFEYDGIWHFENIKDQLEFKQFKDRLLEEWCLDHEYRLIRLDELEYRDVQQVVDLVYNSTTPIIKIGERY